MKLGDIILCPVFSIADSPKPIKGSALLFELIEKDGHYFLKYRITEGDLRFSYEQIFLKFKFICIGLSVATIGHFWVQDVLFDEELKPIWTRSKSLQLIVNKEIESSGPTPLTAYHYLLGQNLVAWISLNYPRVFTYYTIGLFLLRSSLPTEYLYADVLLNYFKIVELVTYTRIEKKPKLQVIIADSKTLNITCVDKADIRKFYVVRSRDAAHDYDKVRGINRQQAVECKMWVDELIMKDMDTRVKKHRTAVIKVAETPQGAILEQLHQGDA